jgi:hypothetical protein
MPAAFRRMSGDVNSMGSDLHGVSELGGDVVIAEYDCWETDAFRCLCRRLLLSWISFQ